jgi:DNA-binding transcriptional MerR regulator
METYRKKQLVEALSPIVNITEPTIAYYLKLGILTPDVANPSGRSEIKYYGPENLVDAAIAATLEEHGLRLKAIAAVMQSIRKGVRAVYKQLKNIYRLHLIISNPNTDNSKSYLQMCLEADYQRQKNKINPAEVRLSMDDADSYIVVDLSKLIARMGHLL